MLVDTISWIALLSGGFLLITSATGMLRFPDFFTRMHAAGITETLGAGTMVLGMALQTDGQWLVLSKLFCIMLFILLTGPTASHVLAKAALHRNQQPLLGDQAKQ